MDGAVAAKTQDLAGVALIKKQFILKREETDEPNTKKIKLEEGEKTRKKRGQFKNRFKDNRKHLTGAGPDRLCNTFVDVAEDVKEPTCNLKDCKFMHDVSQFLATKPADIGNECPLFTQYGYCPRGLNCRFGKAHISASGRNLRNGALIEQSQVNGLRTVNSFSRDTNILLRKKMYDFSKSINALKMLPNYKALDADAGHGKREGSQAGVDEEVSNNDSIGTNVCCSDTEKEAAGVKAKTDKDNGQEEILTDNLGPCSDEDRIKLHKSEKQRIDWRGKLYLSPLTTLGNLPFRRICKEFGADVTCGEMAMATSILQTQQSELALLKRHHTEDLFGVQLCGNNPYVMTRCAQLLEETLQVDFIDVNLGCPIDAVYHKGGGSGLLRREKVLDSVVKSMARVTNLPLTVKTRTGIQMGKNIAHRLMPIFTAADVSLVTVHGRSREQRYTRLPDWGYIEECARAAAPTPVFGNGDVLSYRDYTSALSLCPSISGVMVGRGALYKPWIFTEIKEQRDWDISSGERLDIIKKYVRNGLEHWGSDTRGVEMTRKFLLEWLSFLYRYIPVGLLERPPQKINERPPRYMGRDDLETLMASANCADWVHISEMLLGPVPEGFHFLPKHKANSWAG